MDRLKRSHFLDDLSGKVFLSQYEAAAELGALPATAKAAS